jgi:hypothetical protein
VTALIVAVFLASLTGSLHCAGMCGPFVALYAGGDPSRGLRRGAAHAVYNSGRLAGYLALGAIAGSLGAALDVAGETLAGVQRIAAVAAGLFIAGVGAATLLRLRGVRVPELGGVPRPLRRLVARATLGLRERPPVVRAALLGGLAVFLPCGWLWAFGVSAAGTGSPLWGAVVMGVFWLGTLPVMVGVGLGVQAVAGPLRRLAPALTAVALVVVGLWAVAGRMPAIGGRFAEKASKPPVSADAAARQVEAIDQSELPCCHDDEE